MYLIFDDQQHVTTHIQVLQLHSFFSTCILLWPEADPCYPCHFLSLCSVCRTNISAFSKTYAGTQQMIQCYAPMTKLIISSSIKNGLYCTTYWLAVNKWIKVGHLKESLLMFSKTICAQALRVHFIWLLLLLFISIIIIVIIVTSDTLRFYL